MLNYVIIIFCFISICYNHQICFGFQVTEDGKVIVDLESKKEKQERREQQERQERQYQDKIDMEREQRQKDREHATYIHNQKMKQRQRELIARKMERAKKQRQADEIAKQQDSRSTGTTQSEFYELLSNGYNCIKKMQYDMAINYYNNALSIKEDGSAYYNRALAYYYKGQYGYAKDDIAKAKKLGAPIDPKIENLLSKY